MRILFLITNLGSQGGTERVTTLIANKLSAIGHSISIASIEGYEQPVYEIDSRVSIYNMYFSHVSLKKKYISIVHKTRSFLKKGEYDALVIVNTGLSLIAIPAAFNLNLKIINWEHFNLYADVNKGSMFRHFSRWGAALFSDYIVTLTEKDKSYWISYFGSWLKSNIVNIPNPVSFEELRYSSSEKTKTILSIGRLNEQKGFDMLIEAWRSVAEKHPDWILNIIGDGDEEKNLKNLVKKYDLEKNISIKSFNPDIEYEYRNAKFYCLSSRYEGLPMVLLEAQSYGIPIISFDCDTGPSDIIEHGYNGFIVKNGDIDQLSFFILKAIDLNDSDYSIMSFNSANNSKKYAIADVVKLWNNILID
ncbi:glycosyltransferase family 4 protein [Pectobacterium fontis]|uniref:Glycosyltransferase family 4 protein n=1 Tax=Pectobacterium fontis TaxID=2558042 RepID=A0A7V8ILE2_9GAMM|nr:glycosyltransferase family 4 protein [Pectobacterium fontis]KHN54688.1 hypothetical protein OI69_03280 [Pectobacterium fontis]